MTDLGTIIVPRTASAAAAEDSVSLLRTLASVGVGFIPYVGVFQSLMEVATGMDIFTGEPVNRALSALGAMAGLIPGWQKVS